MQRPGELLRWSLMCLHLVLLPKAVLAQTPCSAEDADIYQTWRRAQVVIDDYEAFHDRHRDDLARNERFAEETGQTLPWRFDLAAMAGVTQTFGFDVCSNVGSRSARLMPMEVGALASVDLYRLGVGAEFFILQRTDNLVASPTEAQTRTEDGGVREPTGLASVRASEWMIGGRLTLHRWASLVGGRIASRPFTQTPGEDGVILDVPESLVTPPSYYLGAGTPVGGGLLHLVFEPEDVRADAVGLRFDDIPLHRSSGDIPAPLAWRKLRGIVGGSWFSDERRAVVDLGVRQLFGHFSLLTSTEMTPVRLRGVTARADWWGGPVKTLESVDPETDVTHAARFAMYFGAFGQVSYFDSAHLEDQTERRRVIGTAIGLTARPDITIFMVQIDVWFGLNQPDELSRIAQFVDHWQMGLRLHTRFGL